MLPVWTPAVGKRYANDALAVPPAGTLTCVDPTGRPSTWRLTSRPFLAELPWLWMTDSTRTGIWGVTSSRLKAGASTRTLSRSPWATLIQVTRAWEASPFQAAPGE